MLKKQNRLVTKFEFNIARKYGKSYSAQLFHIYYLEPRNYRGTTKIGLVVSNKLCKTAVGRNRLKRLFREALRRNFDKINDNLWIVIHPKFVSLNKSYEEIYTDITKTLQKIPITRQLRA